MLKIKIVQNCSDFEKLGIKVHTFGFEPFQLLYFPSYSSSFHHTYKVFFLFSQTKNAKEGNCKEKSTKFGDFTVNFFFNLPSKLKKTLILNFDFFRLFCIVFKLFYAQSYTQSRNSRFLYKTLLVVVKNQKAYSFKVCRNLLIYILVRIPLT